MRTSSLLGIVLSAFIPAAAFSQAPSSGASASSHASDPCPGATAFIEKEKQRDAMHRQAKLSPTQPALSTELEEMVARDQEARKSFFGAPDAAKQATLAAVDAANLPRLKGIVAQFGFPTVAQVGRDGVRAAWLLIQHADTDPAFQKKALALIEANPSDAVRPGDVAMLSDRIRIHEGKLQRFGSNFDLKTMQPTPIEDPEHVDERRAKVRLMPMADYTCEIKLMYAMKK